jgi:non-ribosomal peptide synthetase component F
MLSEIAGAMRGYWGYSSELFEGATIEQMHRRFMTLLHSIIANPEARLRDLELFTEDEKQQQERSKKRRQILNTSKLKVAKRRSVSVSSELPEAVEKL